MLTIQDLAVFYGDAQALDGVSLDVPEGAIVAIVGANGAGKTSLIRTIAPISRFSETLSVGNTCLPSATCPMPRLQTRKLGQPAMSLPR